MRYRRAYRPGGAYFFTVVTAERRSILVGEKTIGVLREAMRQVRTTHPLRIDAAVILPDHLHCIWTLRPNDADFSTRWRLIKTRFTQEAGLRRPCWQPRFWEHLIRDEHDYAHHVDYIHFNPVKHDYAARPADWPWSSFSRHVAHGHYLHD